MTPKQYTLELAKRGYRVYPLVPNTKQPLKGQSYLTASNDEQEISNWFDVHGNINVGLDLAWSWLIVVDIDNHAGASIRKTILKLAEYGYNLPAETYIEQTPSGGLHFFYTGTVPVKRITNFIPNVDLLADFTVIAPSSINGDAYRSITDQYNYTKIRPAPLWLIQAMQERKPVYTDKANNKPITSKNWTGKKLDEIVTGTNAGDRNNWLTRQVGWLVRTGADPKTVYTIAQQINRDYITPPLPDSEVNTIFKSIIRREVQKYDR